MFKTVKTNNISGGGKSGGEEDLELTLKATWSAGKIFLYISEQVNTKIVWKTHNFASLWVIQQSDGILYHVGVASLKAGNTLCINAVSSIFRS